MDESMDIISVLNLDEWTSRKTGVMSHIKSTIKNLRSTNQSDMIAKTLRQAIVYFAETLNEKDQSSCVLGDEFRSTRTHTYDFQSLSDEKNSDEIERIEITTYAPIAFDHMRSVIGITRNDFHSSFSIDEFKNLSNTGKSGSRMFKTSDDIYIIKTVRDHEAKYLIRMLSGLYVHFAHGSSLMTRYIGLYSVNICSTILTEVFCVVMLNNLPKILDLHEIFDLKGSSVGRYSSMSFPLKRSHELKDLDFKSLYPYGIRIPHNVYRRLRLILESDIHELRKLMITDFSLLLGVYHLDQRSGKSDENLVKIVRKSRSTSNVLFLKTIIDETNEISVCSNTKSIDKYIMKPLNLIGCSQEPTFDDNEMALLMLGIPGLTHDGRRVLLYPALIDCLQTFDNFKRIQNMVQNITDSKRSSEYSVIHPYDYEQRLLRFLFEKVLIDSKQTLNELLASPTIRNNSSQIDLENSQ